MTAKKFRILILIIILICSPLMFVSSTEASGKHPKGSKIADQYIEGKTNSEVRSLLEDAIISWQAGEDILIQSPYEIVELPRAAFTFDIERTVQEFNKKTKRKFTSFFMKPKNVQMPLHVKIDPSHDTVKQLKQLDYIDVDQIFTDATNIASELTSGKVTLAYTDQERIPFETISEVSFASDLIEDLGLHKSITALDGQPIHAHDSFSLLQHIELDRENKKEDANVLATHLYNLFLQTNVHIAERHMPVEISSDATAGLEASVDMESGKDLVVVNPNPVAFIWKVEETNDTYSIALESADHPYSYKIDRDESEISPRTIYRYSESMADGQEKVIQEGEPGLRVIVDRNIIHDKKNTRETERISHDIYTFVPTIILASPKDEETVQEETLEDQVDDLEGTIDELEKNLENVQEEASSNSAAKEMIISLAQQLESVQEQQAECMHIIAAIQEQLTDSTNGEHDDTNQQLFQLYESMHEQLMTIAERLETLEEKVENLKDSSESGE